MKQRLIKAASCSIACLILVMQPVASALAVTITVGKGTGIIWEGLPFNVTLSAPIGYEYGSAREAVAGISSDVFCQPNNRGYLRDFGGYRAALLSQGLGLIPRARVMATYERYDGTMETFTGTIGVPDIKGSTSEGGDVGTVPETEWCLPARMKDVPQFYRRGGKRSVTVSGSWLLVADGTQTSGMAKFTPMNAISTIYPRISQSILPDNIEIRVTNIMCSISTPVAVNFGTLFRDTEVGAEMARQVVSLGASCSQEDDERINVNINLQVHGISGLYNNEPSRLALDQGGGYITGEVSDGVTGSGNCKATTGLRFDDYQLKLGDIKAWESSKSFNRQLTWRLCSGGSSLPTGEVTASAEMLVTFN